MTNRPSSSDGSPNRSSRGRILLRLHPDLPSKPRFEATRPRRSVRIEWATKGEGAAKGAQVRLSVVTIRVPCKKLGFGEFVAISRAGRPRHQRPSSMVVRSSRPQGADPDTNPLIQSPILARSSLDGHRTTDLALTRDLA